MCKDVTLQGYQNSLISWIRCPHFATLIGLFLRMSLQHVTIHRRRRLKYIRLAIKDDATIRVTVPFSYTERDVSNLLDRKRDWILKHVQHMKEQALSRKQKSYDILYRGEECTVAFAEFMKEPVRFADEELCFYVRGDLRGKHKAAIDKWCRKQAEEYIPRRVAQISAPLGLSYQRIFLRSQKTRWGTCSAKGNLSFNWKLMKAPPWILDYVIYHELAHLKIFSHSKRYWALLGSWFPQYQQARKWLRVHGHSLHE